MLYAVHVLDTAIKQNIAGRDWRLH